MKKVIILLMCMVVTLTTFSQEQNKSKFNYRVGLATSLPTDTYSTQSKVGIGSTFMEVGYKYSKKIIITLNAGYLRYVNGGESFAQIPILPGARYLIDNMFYFGASGGATFYSKKEFGNFDFMFSPYIGFQVKHISFDVRYFNTVRTVPIKTIGFVLSYTL